MQKKSKICFPVSLFASFIKRARYGIQSFEATERYLTFYLRLSRIKDLRERTVVFFKFYF